MKQRLKIYERAFKEKAVKLNHQRTNVSQLALELGVATPQLYKQKKEHLGFILESFPGNGLSSKLSRKFKITIDFKCKYNTMLNILNREFTVALFLKVRVLDITYIRVKERFLYPTTVIDLYDWKIIGWILMV